MGAQEEVHTVRRGTRQFLPSTRSRRGSRVALAFQLCAIVYSLRGRMQTSETRDYNVGAFLIA